MEEIEAVQDCLVVAQKLPDGDERVVLFVTPMKGQLDDTLRDTIKHNIKAALSSRHIPAKMIHLDRIPYTTNGKRLEVRRANAISALHELTVLRPQIPVKKLVNGTPWDKLNLSSAEDPLLLKQFENHPDLRLPTKAKL